MKYYHFLWSFVFFPIVSCGLLSGGNSTPDIPGKVVFSAKDEAGNSQIFSIKANGKGLKQLTHFPAEGEAMQPSWSPDGSQIIFSSFSQGTSLGPALWVMNADGSSQRVLYDAEPDNSDVPPLPGYNAQWSPDGTKVVFDLCLNCQIRTNNDIYVFDIPAKELTQVTQDSASDTNPVWSPDGQRIAFTTGRDYVDADTLRFRKDIYLTDVDGLKVERLTETGYARKPIWGSNENYIIFRSSNPDLNLGLFQLDIETSNIVEIKNDLTGVVQVIPYSQNFDGNFILVTGRDQSKPRDYTMYFIDVSGNRTIEISFGPADISGADWFVPNDN